eukprot:gene8332-25274_t
MSRSDDPRMGTLFTSDHTSAMAAGKRVVSFIYFPFDEGTARNGGRVGGASSAAVVREMVMKMGAVKNAEHGIDLADHIALGPGCTGIIATDKTDGTVNHARNLDFSP